MSAGLDHTMIGAISSGTNQVAGALLALINPRATGQSERRPGVTKVDGVSPAEATNGPVGKSELTEEERKEVEKLNKRDAEVRRHEQAHKGAAGSYAKGAPTFEYETGPDGRQYAAGGEVSIDTAKIPDDPQATIRKMQTIRRAASAPSEPSSKDRQIAAKAAQMEQQARAEMAEQRRAEVGGETKPSESSQALPPAVSGAPAANTVPGAKIARTTNTAAAAIASSVAMLEAPGRFLDVTV